MAKKRKKFSHLSMLRKGAVGAQLSWTDANPLDPQDRFITNMVVSHRNPVRKIYAVQMYKTSEEWLIHRAVLTWRVTLTGVFDYGAVEQHEIREIEARCILNQLDDHANEQIKEILRFGDNFKYMRFDVECVGL